MTRFAKKQKKEIGLAPDEIFFRGEQKAKVVLLRIIDFDTKNQEEKIIETVADVLNYKNKKSVTWFNIDGLHDTSLIEEIASGFQFDQLVLADVMDVHSRPRINEYDACISLSIKMLQKSEISDKITVENLSIILTESVLLSFQEKRGDVFEPVRDRIRNKKRRIRKSGTDYLLFSLLDIVVDNYIHVISILGEKIENLEDKLLETPNPKIINQINKYKKELNFLRKNINPAREMILALSKMETDLIDAQNEVHFKELLGNINQAIETTDSYREILSDELNIYHTTISSKLNDIMKFLTVFSVVFIPLTFIAGISGQISKWFLN